MKSDPTGESTNILRVPSPDADDGLVNLADWVEAKALLDGDSNASRQDLTLVLKRDYSLPEERVRQVTGDVFNELADRLVSCANTLASHSKSHYPFTLSESGSLLTLRGSRANLSRASQLYIFLLVVSRWDMDSRRRLCGIDPTQTFERLCADVLLDLWGGRTELSDALVFGTARKKAQHNTKFQSNVEHLCYALGEGGGFRSSAKPPGAGDGKLDVVVWRRFSDGREGGLVGFGQCKTGLHWKSELSKLIPKGFCRKFFQQALLVDPVTVFMVPHRVDKTQWTTHIADGGGLLLLDRCRLALHGNRISDDVFGDCNQWLDAALGGQGIRQFAA